jgi:hypothetical protein
MELVMRHVGQHRNVLLYVRAESKTSLGVSLDSNLHLYVIFTNLHDSEDYNLLGFSTF